MVYNNNDNSNNNYTCAARWRPRRRPGRMMGRLCIEFIFPYMGVSQYPKSKQVYCFDIHQSISTVSD